MFDVFKKDIKIGDRVKLYLTTGKEPEGNVLEIGDSFVLLQINDITQNRFFDKLIGGWDVIFSKENHVLIKEGTDNIFKEVFIQKTKSLSRSLDQTALSMFISSNCTIINSKEQYWVASNDKFPEILIHHDLIASKKLLDDLQNSLKDKSIPIFLSFKIIKGRIVVFAAATPSTIEDYLHELMYDLNEENFNKAYLVLSVLRNVIINNEYLKEIVIEFNRFNRIKNAKVNKNTEKNLKIENKYSEDKKAFKNVEKEINELIRNSNFEFALSQIDSELSSQSIEVKYKSNLLLKKAQIYSSVNNPVASERAYQELVEFNEKIGTPSNNLSHLYTELARLQALKIDKQSEALISVRKALRHNPNNNYALSLLHQFEGRIIKSELHIFSENTKEEHLLIEAEDDTTAISKMIDLDIKEHKYTHPEIIRNGGKPTAFIAKSILDEAKKTKEVDLSERFPIYLEAAKAFSELNIGSYDLQDYFEAIAYYSMLKGNSLFINYRNSVLNGEFNILKLTRLRDSSCSYYLESLNLLSNIEPKSLLSILANYLKLNLVTYHIQNESNIDYKLTLKGQFSDVFKDCLRNKNKEIEVIAYNAIVDCGASSINAWNKLAQLPKGTGKLYDEFYIESNRIRIFELINEHEKSNVDIRLTPSEFLKTTFQNRKKNALKFNEDISKIFNFEIEPHNLDFIIMQWNQLSEYEGLLSYTDIEIKKEIDNLLSIFQPYLNRNLSERTNILIQVRNNIDKLIRFINENTTYYGRTFFYGLLNKWKRETDILIEEKITQSYPLLEVSIDPQYYVETNSEITAPLMIRNIGEATSEGFSLKIICESTEYEEHVEIPYSSNIEIASEGKIEMNFIIPKQLIRNSKAVEITVDVQAIYQKKLLTSKLFEFTVEEEPKSVLIYEDIPWRDGPIPPEQLFKGRKKLIADLAQHYLSIEKDKPYILYGLTRTGKSSILEYLKKDIEGSTFLSKGREMLVLTFSWDLSEAASFKKAPDFWRYILLQQTLEEIEKYAIKYNFDIKGLEINENARAKDFRVILEFLRTKNIYPIFCVDEFSFIKTLIDDNTINSAFLHTLRQFSLNELASFVFAGTYDIKSLIRDEKYGITGQLVNAIEEQVNEINDEAAEELIEVINDKLSFTPEAIGHIKFLSGNIPYFIQIICKYCGYFAAENKRRYIGYPELEKVIKILIGQIESSPNSLVKKLPENVFQNNQFSPVDPKEVAVLISSIAYFNKDRIFDPRGVGFSELQKLWADKNINAFRPRLAESINLLKEKKIIIQEEDEGIPVYKLSVDLFRRWWASHNLDINLTLTTLTE